MTPGAHGGRPGTGHGQPCEDAQTELRVLETIVWLDQSRSLAGGERPVADRIREHDLWSLSRCGWDCRREDEEPARSERASHPGRGLGLRGHCSAFREVRLD